ncbi:MAG: acyl-CoA dehydrogenase family protein [Jatrophihabitans sp.]|uniref:acyl-CoA dehydrogenase family protein n=1 Tax=Jatrophihabitans sp. TaxID=1932789 RepID=UPI003F7D15F9
MSELDDLAAAVRGLLTKQSDSAAVRRAAASDTGYDADLWRRLAEIGAPALLVPEEHGGVGAGRLAMTAVMTELGRTLTPSPLLGSGVLATELLLALGDGLDLLPALAEGTSVAAVCWSGDDGAWTPVVEAVDGRLTGTAHYVLNGDTADVLLVAATDGAVYLAEGGDAVATPTVDVTRRLATVTVDGTPARRLGPADAGAALARARASALVALAAEATGAAEAALERTVAYVTVRHQFGRAIGSFQAIKHRLADLHVVVEGARSMSLAAAAGQVDGEAAALVCSEALQTVTAEMIQLHGGIAITWEHDAHLFFKRAHGSAHLFGSPAARLGAVAVLAGVS